MAACTSAFTNVSWDHRRLLGAQADENVIPFDRAVARFKKTKPLNSALLGTAQVADMVDSRPGSRAGRLWGQKRDWRAQCKLEGRALIVRSQRITCQKNG